VLFAGGEVGPIDKLIASKAAATLYDPKTRTWQSVADMPENRGYHTATPVGATVLFTGGETIRKVGTSLARTPLQSADMFGFFSSKP
jgi:hypothetical protein